jgi:hypothetical protein
MFHNKKNVDHQSSSSQSRGRTIQLKVTSKWETNTMTEQTWVITNDHMNNDHQVHKSKEEKNKVNNQLAHHGKRSKQTSLAQEARCKIKQL